MTREDAIKVLNHFPIDFRRPGCFEVMEALKLALSTLRPVSREQVEKVWRGEWVNTNKEVEQMCKCSKCGYPISYFWSRTQFCPNCGAPMTDEAVEIVMKRFEALHEITE